MSGGCEDMVWISGGVVTGRPAGRSRVAGRAPYRLRLLRAAARTINARLGLYLRSAP
ncbi:hypothetical protein GCM10018780_85510 [Streptomyces lanatus]|nr:hypothetical protein GCM10018780_85510 [Streptomyces lanatus]